MKPAFWIIGTVVLIVVLVGGFLYVQSQKGEPQVKITPAPSTQQEQSTESSTTTDNQKVEVSVETVTLKAVAPYSGMGTATRIFANGVFIHTAVANIGDPAEGKFYEGWLVKKTPSLKLFSTGKLVKEGDVYKLTFIASQDYSDYKNVMITEETSANGLDGVPEAHVLEGTFSN